MIEATELLKRFLVYAEYNPEQRSFNLLSSNYYMHKTCKAIARIMEFDPSATIGVMYAKNAFLSLCQEASIKVLDVLQNPDFLKEEREMYSIFQSQEFDDTERAFLDAIDVVVQRVCPQKQLGQRDREKEKAVLFQSVDAVVDELSTCREDLFLKGGPIQPIRNFDAHIHVFDQLAECLLALEKANDGLYICYIANYGSNESWFGFFIKSNGTILALDERVPEHFPGEHAGHRNARWTEKKKYNLFPYASIVHFVGSDYKGYAKQHEIDQSKLELFDLGADAYMPIILAMVMISRKYEGRDVANDPLILVDSFFRVNEGIALPDSQALMIPKESLVASPSREYTIPITTEDVLSGAPAKEYGGRTNQDDESNPNRFLERGCLSDQENIFVSLYGAGFQLDTSKLLLADRQKKLNTGYAINSVYTVYIPEFIGTEKQMSMNAYVQGRQQLADYIRDRMFDELKAIGGQAAIEKWFEDAVKKYRDRIIDLCIRKWNIVHEKNEKNVVSRHWDVAPSETVTLRYIGFQENCSGYVKDYPGLLYPFNQQGLNRYHRPDSNKNLCINTGSLASIIFVFKPMDWKEMEEILGPVPKILKGWQKHGHSRTGNSILDVTDPVEDIGTPFEKTERDQNDRYVGMYRYYSEETNKKLAEGTALPIGIGNFDFGVAFSRRGWAQELKKRDVAH